MPTILFGVFFFSFQTADNDTLQLLNSRHVEFFRRPGPSWRPDPGEPEKDRKLLPVHLLFVSFPFCFNFFFCEEAPVEDKAAASDRGARSKYSPGPEWRACATACLSSNTPPPLGLTRGKPSLCKYRLRFSSVVRGRRGEMDGNMEKGVAEREGEEWYRKRGWGGFCGWGNKRGNQEAESDI